jgi:probable rRNA maturation factor
MQPDPLISWRRKPASLDLSLLESFAETLRDRVAGEREFHCRITNDTELADLNSRFRGKNQTTDVLSFPSGESFADKRANGRLGDIAISLDRARAQAKEWRHSTEDEIRTLLLHGVLHLTGLDHETDSGQMRRAELRWRRKLGLASSLIQRANSKASPKKARP